MRLPGPPMRSRRVTGVAHLAPGKRGDAIAEMAPLPLDPRGPPMTTSPQQVPGVTRTDLQEHDLSIPDRVMIQNRVEFTPDAAPFRHKHPGEEVIYVLEGELEYSIDGRAPQIYRAGDALTVPPE